MSKKNALKPLKERWTKSRMHRRGERIWVCAHGKVRTQEKDLPVPQMFDGFNDFVSQVGY